MVGKFARWVVIAGLAGTVIGLAGPAAAQEASPEPSITMEASAQPAGADVVDIYPKDIGAGPVADEDLMIVRGEELVEFMLGADPEPLDRLALEDFGATDGHSLDDATMINGWHRFADGDVNLAGLQLPGAETTLLADAMLALGSQLMWFPEVEVWEIAGKDVTVFHTEESLGKLNYLYVSDDIGWFFVAPEPYVEMVLDHLPE